MTTLTGSADIKRTVVGYCWPWTVRPGESLDFMVNSAANRPYRADLVRIICGDNLTSARMFKEVELDAPFSREHPGHERATHTGSYAEIQAQPVLDRLQSFTVQAIVCPALIPGGVRIRAGGGPNSTEEVTFADQHLISRWDDLGRIGWSLFIDPSGRPALRVGEGARAGQVTLDRPLVQDRWFLIWATVDTNKNSLRISARPWRGSPAEVVAWPETHHEESLPGQMRIPQAGPLRFAACTGGPGNGSRLKPAGCFNGRLDRVRITQGILAADAVAELCSESFPAAMMRQIIGAWDFGRNIDGIEVTDASPNGLNGEVVNAPARGVRGADWNGSCFDWRQCPAHYSAIHFHDDDLYDAQWGVDFSYSVPQDLKSGIYAVRIRQGESEEYIPFFVAPPRGVARAKLALLIPTASYTAYTNITGLTTLSRKKTLQGADGIQTITEDTHPCLMQNRADAEYLLQHLRVLGKGIYSNHTDGMLAHCASQRHPNMTIKPKSFNWTLVADSYLVDWLESKEIDYDIITDDLLHAEGADLLSRYAVVMTGTHPEYYTLKMIQALEVFQGAGGRLMYLGGNGFYWVTSYHSQLPGLIEVRKDSYAGGWPASELRHSFDGVPGGLWELLGRSSARLTGVVYVKGKSYAMEGGSGYRRLPDSYDARAEFVFAGVDAKMFGDFGLFSGGAAGQEVDRIHPEYGTPAHTLHLARADAFPKFGSMLAPEYKSQEQMPVADMTFFETPNGGAVFSVGSMSWAGALSHQSYDNDVSRITENVLRRFMDGAPFEP